MVKHIVMFKLKESLSENEKIEIMNLSFASSFIPFSSLDIAF